MSDVDLIVVAEPGQREAIWADRAEISRDLLGAEVVEAHEVPHQRPFRWQARTADLRMLDLALDEGSIEMWGGLASEVEFLLDRADLAREREAWIAAYEPPRYDTVGQDDETWAILSWLAGALLHGRVWLVRWGLTDLIGRRILPVTDQPSYALGASSGDDHLIAAARCRPAQLDGQVGVGSIAPRRGRPVRPARRRLGTSYRHSRRRRRPWRRKCATSSAGWSKATGERLA